MQIFLAAMAFIFLCSCSHSPKQVEQVMPTSEAGHWEIKAKVTDLKRQTVNIIDLDVLAQKPNKMRIEAAASLGINLATIVLKNDEISYALYRQKRFYFGKASNKSLIPLFQFALDPFIFMNFCFDQNFKSNGWNCTKDSNGKDSSCTNEELKTVLTWEERTSERRRVKVTGSGFELQILFKAYSSKVELNPNVFDLSAPEGFSRYKLN